MLTPFERFTSTLSAASLLVEPKPKSWKLRPDGIALLPPTELFAAVDPLCTPTAAPLPDVPPVGLASAMPGVDVVSALELASATPCPPPTVFISLRSRFEPISASAVLELCVATESPAVVPSIWLKSRDCSGVSAALPFGVFASVSSKAAAFADAWP